MIPPCKSPGCNELIANNRTEFCEVHGYIERLKTQINELNEEVTRLDAAGQAIALKRITIESAYEIQADELRDAYVKIEQLQTLLAGARGGAGA